MMTCLFIYFGGVISRDDKELLDLFMTVHVEINPGGLRKPNRLLGIKVGWLHAKQET